jgi:hypothetical protein
MLTCHQKCSRGPKKVMAKGEKMGDGDVLAPSGLKLSSAVVSTVILNCTRRLDSLAYLLCMRQSHKERDDELISVVVDSRRRI